MGGVGLSSAEHHSLAAYIASNIQSRPIIDKIFPNQVARRPLNNAFLLLQQHTGNASYTSEELLLPNSNQHSLCREIIFTTPKLSWPTSRRGIVHVFILYLSPTLSTGLMLFPHHPSITTWTLAHSESHLGTASVSPF